MIGEASVVRHLTRLLGGLVDMGEFVMTDKHASPLVSDHHRSPNFVLTRQEGSDG